MSVQNLDVKRRGRAGRSGPEPQVRKVRWLAPLVLGILSAGPLTAQETSSLAQIETRYQSVWRDYELAVAAKNAQEVIKDEALAQVNLARELGDDPALEEARRRYQAKSRELTRLDDRVRDIESALLEARRGLLDGLDDERMTLKAQLLSETDQQTIEIIFDKLFEVFGRYQQLDNQAVARAATPTTLISWGSIVMDDRDGRDELQAKAELLERRAQYADSLIAEYDLRIERLESQLTLEQNRDDFLGGVERFGDNQLPGISARPESLREEGTAAPSDEIKDDLPLETRIEALRDRQEWLRDQRLRDLDMADEFRARIMQIT